jgi:uncharacterized protein (TIGR00661 family)
MKYMFVVQGEGRGHLTQAISMHEILKRNGDEVTEVLVGINEMLVLPSFFRERMKCPVSTFSSSCFLFSAKHKKSLFFRSIFYNLRKLPGYVKSMRFIKKRINENDVGLVINFYEIMTGLTYAFMRPQTPYVCIAHQYLFFHPDFVFPKKNKLQLAGLLLFTRLTCLRASGLLALSFREMQSVGKLCVVPPLIRAEVRRRTPVQGNYILGYMLNAGFSEQVLDWHYRNKDVLLHFFWDKKDVSKEWQVDETLTFHPLDDTAFLDYMAGCKAYSSTGGFESICEAFYLQKPVMMIPAHIEQECNAFDAVNSGVGISADKFDLFELLTFLPLYQPDTTFVAWVDKGDFMIVNGLKVQRTRSFSKLEYATPVINKLFHNICIKQGRNSRRVQMNSIK